MIFNKKKMCIYMFFSYYLFLEFQTIKNNLILLIEFNILILFKVFNLIFNLIFNLNSYAFLILFFIY